MKDKDTNRILRLLLPLSHLVYFVKTILIRIIHIALSQSTENLRWFLKTNEKILSLSATLSISFPILIC